MQSIRNRRWNTLALILAYVVAFQSGLAAFGVAPIWAGSANVSAQLCRDLAGSDHAPGGDHDADRCKIVCASGTCTSGHPEEKTNLHPLIGAIVLVGVHRIVLFGEQAFTPLARGPPLSSV